MGLCNDQEATIERALGALTPDLVSESAGDWRFVVENGAKVGVRARIVDHWLELTASSREAAPVTPSQAWSMLRYNASLNGAVRLALAPGAVSAHLRAEMFLEDDTDVEACVGALSEDMRLAFPALYDTGHLSRPSPAAEPDEVDQKPQEVTRLVQLCADAGWACAERASGRVEVAIDSGSALYQAQLELTHDGTFSVVVDLVDASTLRPLSRAATAVLLLTVAAVVRSVKGMVVTRGGVQIASLAAACESPRSVATIDHALSALTVACRLAGREAQALRHETLAREYLAWRTPASPDETQCAMVDNHNNRYEIEESSCLQPL